MPNDTNQKNSGASQPLGATVTDNVAPTPAVVNTIQTEMVDVPAPPLVKQDGNIDNAPGAIPEVSGNIKAEDTTPAVSSEPTLDTLVTGNVKGNLNTASETPTTISGNVETLKGGSSSKNKFVVPTILGLLLLMGGLAAGVLLIRQNQNVREKAEITTCSGCLDASGNCIEAGSTTNAQCGSGGASCISCTATQTCTNGSCTTKEVQTPAIQCLSVKAYKVVAATITNPASWTLLTQNDLKSLKKNDIVYFTITGKSADISKFTKARFKINSKPFVESTDSKPKSTTDPTNEIEFYYKYTIPADTTQFTVNSAIYHTDQGWIDSVE